jgi:hypothetical protein
MGEAGPHRSAFGNIERPLVIGAHQREYRI